MLRHDNTTPPTARVGLFPNAAATSHGVANHPARDVSRAGGLADASGSAPSSRKGTAAGGSKAPQRGATAAPGGAADRGRKAPLGITGTFVGRFALADPLNERKIKEKAEERRCEKRTRLFVLQRVAADIIGGPEKSGVATCCWGFQFGRSSVGVMLKEYDESRRRASFEGVQRCGSVWHCPVCGKVISARRRAEMNTALAVVRAAGGFPVLMTLTARHGRRDDLADLLDRMKRANRRMKQRRDYKALKAAHEALTITATEVTHGHRHGWHPHFHILMFLAGVKDEAEAVAAVEALRPAWMAAMATEGLDGNGAAFDVRGAGAAGDYVAKWGAAEELSFGDAKAGRKGNRTPLQLLDDAADGDAEARRLWAVYAAAFKGRNQLVWSPGLKAACGLGEVEDGEAAGDELADEPQEAFRIERDDWKARGRYRRGRILAATERGGEAAGRAALAAQDEDAPPRRREGPPPVFEVVEYDPDETGKVFENATHTPAAGQPAPAESGVSSSGQEQARLNDGYSNDGAPVDGRENPGGSGCPDLREQRRRGSRSSVSGRIP